MNKEQIYMVFDVESVGLHGEGFAVGWVVVNGYGIHVQYGMLACDPRLAGGITPKSDGASREWVANNVPAIKVTHGSLREMRTDFWT